MDTDILICRNIFFNGTVLEEKRNESNDYQSNAPKIQVECNAGHLNKNACIACANLVCMEWRILYT